MDDMDEAVAYCLGAGIEFEGDCCHVGAAHRDGGRHVDEGLVVAPSLLEAWQDCNLGGILLGQVVWIRSVIQHMCV